MESPPEIVFRDVTKTAELDALIRDKIAKLNEIHPNLISCNVAIERPQKHQRGGSPYRVRVDTRVPPGHELVVKSAPMDSDMHTSLDSIIRETFKTLRRRLAELKEKQEGETKRHPEQQTQAFVEKLFPDQGYGFLRTVSGEQLYFHQNSVISDDFDRMEQGTGVRYVATIGEKGPQATTVEIVDKPG
jgi:cold shock CspA family protein